MFLTFSLNTGKSATMEFTRPRTLLRCKVPRIFVSDEGIFRDPTTLTNSVDFGWDPLVVTETDLQFYK